MMKLCYIHPELSVVELLTDDVLTASSTSYSAEDGAGDEINISELIFG